MKPHCLLATLLLPIACLTAQDVLHYKFDEHCSNEVINFAAGSSTGNASIVTTLPGGTAAARITGQFDGGLSGTAFPTGGGSTYLNTGWAPTLTNGNFSFSMWIRNHPGNPTAIAFGYLFGASGTGANFRLFTGSSGRMFLSGVPASVTSAADLTTQLNSGWVHIACTVDSTSQQAIWYVNGVADPAVALTQPAAISGTDFTIGARSNTGSSPSPLDTDEFLFSHSVWTPTDVLVLSLAARAGDGDYNAGVISQCGAGNITLGSTGGAPFVGNPGYSFVISAAQPHLFLLLVGLDRCNFGGVVPLPFDGTPILPLLNGCFILADAPILLDGVVVGAPSLVNFPINGGVPIGVSVYTQALGIDLVTFNTSMSNGFASSTGF